MSKQSKLSDPIESRALTEHLAITIAHGAAGSTFEMVRVREHHGAMVNGRCWYAGGKTFDMPTVTAHVNEWVDFIGGDKTIPADALWGYVRAKLGLTAKKWTDEPLSTRLAYTVFVNTLVPLVCEAKAEAKRAADAAAALRDDPPPPNKGVWERSLGQRSGRLGDRVVMSPPKAEAAE